MKLLILGATGRTGKLVLKQALEKGFEVHCIARDPKRLKAHTNLTVFEGDPTNAEDLKAAVNNCDAVISVLNISRTSDFPWAKLRTPSDFLSKTIYNLISLSKDFPLKRVVICSAWGAGDSRKDIPFWFRWVIDYSNVGVAYKDHDRQEELIENYNLSWTIVRPVGLTNSSKKEMIRESCDNQPKPRLTISRNSLAKFLIESINRPDLEGKKVVISS